MWFGRWLQLLEHELPGLVSREVAELLPALHSETGGLSFCSWRSFRRSADLWSFQFPFRSVAEANDAPQ